MGQYSSFTLETGLIICREGEVFLGPGQIRLLKRVMADGSIHAASKNLKMSYQHAWHLLEKVNQLSPLPVLIRQKGGRDGGGCTISPYGKKLIKLFDKKCEELQDFLKQNSSDLDSCFF